MLVYNLKTEQEHHYSEGTDPILTVKTSYAMERGLLTGIATVKDLDDSLFPIVGVSTTIACGDWCTILR